MSEYWSLASYRALLELLKDGGYQFISFQKTEWERQGVSPDTKLCLLRHDVDADMSAALRMATVEWDMGIRSTYFVMTRSPLYNLFSRSNHEHVRNIVSIGHYLGLHFDQGFDAKVDRSDADQIDLEAEMLERMFNVKITAISFHQPGMAVLQGAVCTRHRINTYNKVHLPEFGYISDSNRVFTPLNGKPNNDISLREWIQSAPKRIQILTHPMWWVYQESSTELVWERAIESNFESAQSQLLHTERAYGTRRHLVLGSWCKKMSALDQSE